MKKTILGLISVIVILVVIFSTVLAVNVELNLKLRRKVSTIFSGFEVVESEPRVLYLEKNAANFDPNEKMVLNEKMEFGHTYVNISYLSTDDITTHYDVKNEILSLVGHNQMARIHNDGSIVVNGVKSDLRVSLKKMGDDLYLNLTEFNSLDETRAFGYEELPYTEGSNLIIYNSYDALPLMDVETRWLFQDETSIRSYLRNQYEIDFLYTIKNLFSKAQITADVKSDSVYAYEVDDQIMLAISNQGKIGYAYYSDADVTRYEAKMNKPELVTISRQYPEPIVMTWEAVYSFNPNTDNIGPMASLNVISPTWYELTDDSGSVSSMASEAYVSWAKSRGYEVWALVSNAFNLDRTHAFLHDAYARDLFIEYMIEEAKRYGYEGINIDFENVYMADRDALTHFVHEFAYKTRENNLTLSMDVTVMGGSDNWSKCYDHEKLGEIVDFLIIMTYDEHWASSPISGPVASYDWMLYHMRQLAEVVSPDKLVLGVPFYTRVWREHPSTERANEIRNSSAAIGMEAQNNLIEKYELTLLWDDVDKLYYATFFEENNQVKIWVENARTIEAKLEIIDLLNLKGVAAWRRGFETEDIWRVFEKLNK